MSFNFLQLILGHIIFNFQEDDIVREMNFLKSLYNEAGKSLCLERQRGRREFISCSFLFDIVKLIKGNEVHKLLEVNLLHTSHISNLTSLCSFKSDCVEDD